MRWISIKDLPELVYVRQGGDLPNLYESEIVLVFSKGDIFTAIFYKFDDGEVHYKVAPNFCHSYNVMPDFEEITHWMPLPEFPGENE